MQFFVGIPDCDDGRDELYCGNCDFDTDACGWYDDSAGTYQWDRTQADATPGINTDHTTEDNSGKSFWKIVSERWWKTLGYVYLKIRLFLNSVACTTTLPKFLFQFQSKQLFSIQTPAALKLSLTVAIALPECYHFVYLSMLHSINSSFREMSLSSANKLKRTSIQVHFLRRVFHVRRSVDRRFHELRPPHQSDPSPSDVLMHAQLLVLLLIKFQHFRR